MLNLKIKVSRLHAYIYMCYVFYCIRCETVDSRRTDPCHRVLMITLLHHDSDENFPHAHYTLNCRSLGSDPNRPSTLYPTQDQVGLCGHLILLSACMYEGQSILQRDVTSHNVKKNGIEMTKVAMLHSRSIQHGQFIWQPEQTDIQHVDCRGHVSVILLVAASRPSMHVESVIRNACGYTDCA